MRINQQGFWALQRAPFSTKLPRNAAGFPNDASLTASYQLGVLLCVLAVPPQDGWPHVTA